MSKPDASGPGRLRPVQVLSIKGPEPVVVRFLGGYLGAIMHWHAGRTRPCLGEGACHPTVHRCRDLWRGWAPVEEWGERTARWWPAVLEITENLEHELRDRNLRGECWVLSRPTVKKTGNPVTGIFLERIEERRLRKPFDFEQVLFSLYHCKSFPLGVPNPVPPKLCLDSSEDGPPALWKEVREEKDSPPTPEQMEELRRLRGLMGGGKKPARAPEEGPKLNGHAGTKQH